MAGVYETKVKGHRGGGAAHSGVQLADAAGGSARGVAAVSRRAALLRPGARATTLHQPQQKARRSLAIPTSTAQRTADECQE
jgi:hypothetical protein